MPKQRRIVKNEEIARAEAMTQLHDLVVEVLKYLGIDGLPAPDGGFTTALRIHDIQRQQVRYWDRAWFFQRVETANSTGKMMQCYGPVDLDAGSQPSMLKAFTLCDSPRGRHFDISNRGGRQARDRAIVYAGPYHPIVINGSYQIIDLEPCLCRFDRSFVRHTPQRGFTVKATLMKGFFTGDLEVFCKIVDLVQRGNALDMLNAEVQNYATLVHLQGQVIPKVHGYYNIWGLLRLLALEDVGSMISEAEPIDARTRREMRSALTRIHVQGYVHGDIERRNFCRRGSAVFLVDLEQLRPGTPIEMQAELARIDTL